MSFIYTNPQARHWRSDHAPDLQLIQNFHHKLPEFNESPLVPLDSLAKELGVRAAFVKDESSRLGLPAFKILGASWGTFRAICKVASLPSTTALSNVSATARQRDLTLFAATEGNHGRAVARMAKILGIQAKIFVPEFSSDPVKKNIASEGAEIIVVQGDYDAAVLEASRQSKKLDGGLHIQDNAFEGYDEIPHYIVEGYSTMLTEVEQQLAIQGLKATMIVSPIGVGSLGHAVTAFSKSGERNIAVLTIEPKSAACLHQNLKASKFFTVETSHTIMDGMCCGTVSPISWPVLKEGVDFSATITDQECHDAIQYLHKNGVNAGPCGAGTLAGLLKAAKQDEVNLGLNAESVIVLLSTEGKRWYQEPA